MEITAKEFLSSHDLESTYFEYMSDYTSKENTFKNLKLLTFYKGNQEERVKKNLISSMKRFRFDKFISNNINITELSPFISDYKILNSNAEFEIKLDSLNALYLAFNHYSNEEFKKNIKNTIKEVKQSYSMAQEQLNLTKFFNWYNPMNLVKGKDYFKCFNLRSKKERLVKNERPNKSIIKHPNIFLYGGALFGGITIPLFTSLSSRDWDIYEFCSGLSILIAGSLIYVGGNSSEEMRKIERYAAEKCIESLQQFVENRTLEKFEEEIIDLKENAFPEIEKIKDVPLEVIVLNKAEDLVMPCIGMTKNNPFIDINFNNLNRTLNEIYNRI